MSLSKDCLRREQISYMNNQLNQSFHSFNHLQKGISGSSLKLFALVTMLIDHIGASCMLYYMRFHLVSGQFHNIYSILRSIGRISFPIFIFLLIEGLYHTRNVGRYLLRLLIFCFVSELPFNLAFSYRMFDPDHQNVFFTLFIGLTAVAAIRFLHHHFHVPETILPNIQNIPAYKYIPLYLIDLAIAISAMALAHFLKTDYEWVGVLAIFIAYLLHSFPTTQMWLVCLVLLFSGSLEIYSLFCIPLISCYNGRRGNLPGWFAYLFYPLHLLLLWAISTQLLI